MADRFCLEVLDEGGSARRVPLAGGRVTIGRKPGNAVVVADTHVSSVHAEVVQEADQWIVRDLGSTNGTYLDGRKIDEVLLSPGDEFAVGQTRIRFLDAEAEESAKVVAAPAPARRSFALPLVLLLAVLLAGYAYFQFGRGAASDLPVPAVAGNLLRCASFEAAEGIDPDREWKNEEGSAARFVVGEGRRSGAGGARVTFGEAAVARLGAAEPLAVEDGRAYALAAHAKGDGASVGLRVLFTSSSDPELAAWRGGDFAASGHEWARIEATAVPPPGADRARFFVFAVGSSGSVSVDDLEMRAAEATRGLTVRVNEVECAFDPLGSSLRRVREGWIRGFAVASAGPSGRQPAEASLSPASGSILLPEGIGGTVRTAVEPAGNGVRFRYTHEAGAIAATPAVSFQIHPEYLALEGVTLLGPPGGPTLTANFREEGVVGLVLGEGASRARVGFDRPLAVTGRVVGEGFLEVDAPFSKDLVVTLQVSFEEERRAALDLVRLAQAAEEAKKPAEAIAKYGTVLSEYPFEKGSLGLARERRARLLREGLDRVASLESEADLARFFRLSAAYRQVRAAAEALAGSYDGTEVGDRAKALAARIEEEGRSLEEDLSARERARLEAIAAELEKQEMKALASLVREGAKGAPPPAGEAPPR